MINRPIPDSEFIRGDAPMTKEEIRTLSISKLRPCRESIILDIGAGTGSVSVECALAADLGKVYAVERDASSITLIKENMKKFFLGNIEAVHGDAPGVLSKDWIFDRAFIGGSGGSLNEILAWVFQRISPGGIVVLTAVTMGTLTGAYEFFRKGNHPLEIIQASVSRVENVKGNMMFRPQTPVFIMTSSKDA